MFASAVFSGDAEQQVLVDYFDGRTGVFVEVGAFQPVYLSQTYELEQRGWDGILVEPVAEHADALRRERKARVFECACVGPEKHGQPLPLAVKGGLSSLVLSGDEKVIREVPGSTLDALLDAAGIGSVDFLSVDVEGAEVDVLRGFSLARFQPKLVLIEDFCRDLSRHRYMVGQGYKRVRRTGLNDWYVPVGTAFSVSAFGWLQLARKCFLSMPVRQLKGALKRV